MCADDIATLLSDESYEGLVVLAKRRMAMVERISQIFGLKVDNEKTVNIVYSSTSPPRGIFRRTPVLPCPDTRARPRAQYGVRARTDETCLGFDEFEETGEGGVGGLISEGSG